MIDNDKIILPLTSAEETKEELRIEEQDKEMRRVLKSIKREDWVITDYRLAYGLLESDFLVIGEALYKFYWESPRTKNAA